MPTPRGVRQRLYRKIRWRARWSLLAFGLGAASTWRFREAIFDWLLIPGGGLLSPFDGQPVFTSPTDMLGVTFSLAIKGGTIAAVPVIAVGLFTLFRPLLPFGVRRFIIIFLPALGLSFVGGAAFAYYVMLPVGLNFLLHFGDGVAVPLITITEYLRLMMALMFWLGIVFELPLAMFLLAKLDIVSYRRMRGFRKYVPVAAFFLANIITPTMDAVNSTMVAVPIIALYEVGLFLSWLGRSEGDDYLLVRKMGGWMASMWRWLYGLPGAALYGLVSAAGRAWRRVRHGKVGVWS